MGDEWRCGLMKLTGTWDWVDGTRQGGATSSPGDVRTLRGDFQVELQVKC